jgi:hypothetical protein
MKSGSSRSTTGAATGTGTGTGTGIGDLGTAGENPLLLTPYPGP